MNLRLDRFLTAAVALTVAAVYFLFIHYVPWCNDDWNFREMYLRVSGGEFSFSAGRFADFIGLARLENDGRLSNVADVLFQFAPRAVYDVFFALMCAVWIMLGSGLAVGRGRPCAVAAVAFWAMAVLFLPWRDWIMGSVDYSLNYVVASGVTVAFLWIWLRPLSGASVWPAALLGFVAGCWHEGFSVPVAAGIVLLCICRRRWPDARHAVVFAALLAGIVTAMTAPRLLERVEGEGGMVVIGVSYALRDLPAVLLLAAVFAVSTLRESWRRSVVESWRATPLPLFVGACAVAVAIVLGKGLTPRVSWCAECFAMLALLALFRDRLCSARAIPGAVAFYAAIVVFYAGVIGFQRQTARDMERVLELYGESTDGTVRFDYSADVPVWTLHHPSRSQLTAPATVGFLRSLDPKGRTLKIEPAAAETRQPDEGAE